MKIFVLILLFFVGTSLFSQTFEKTFSGQWARTTWSFEFYKDGTCKRTSSGHYGNTELTGNYIIKNDTVEILINRENSHGTINKYYLLDGDSFLIDLNLMYDYKLSANSWFYNSKKRYDVLPKPNMDSVVTITRNIFDRQIEHATESMKTEVLYLTKTELIQIIRCYNTIEFNKDIYSDSIYQQFKDTFISIAWDKKICKYYDNVPSRGMGFYFYQLQVELLGTPHQWSKYQVIE